MTEEQRERFTKIVDLLRPDAKEHVKELMADPYKTTKDNYAKVMALVSALEKDNKGTGQLFLVAMVKEGYPKQTADQIRSILGW